MSFREYMTNVLLIGLSVAFLIHFLLIVCYGEFYIKESHIPTLVLEIAGITAIIVLAVQNIIGGLK